MPFMFDLDIGAIDPSLAVEVQYAVADAGAWPIHFSPGREERRWFGLRKAYPPVLEIQTRDGQGHVLIDPGHWDEESWRFRPDAIPRLVALINILADAGLRPLVFRATWAGSPIERTERLTVQQLSRRLLDEQINDHTRYVVDQAETNMQPPTPR